MLKTGTDRAVNVFKVEVTLELRDQGQQGKGLNGRTTVPPRPLSLGLAKETETWWPEP